MALRGHQNGQLSQSLQAPSLVVGQHRDQALVLNHAPDGGKAQARAQLRRQILRIQSQCRQCFRIEDHFQLAHVSAQDFHAAHAGYADERRLHHIASQLAQLARIDRSCHIEGHDGKRAGRHLLDHDFRADWQLGARLRDARLDHLQRTPHVGFGAELQGDFGGAADGFGAHARESEHRAERLLQRARQAGRDNLWRRATAFGNHDDARELDLGVDTAGHVQRTDHTNRHQQERAHPNRDRVAAQQLEQLHGASVSSAPSSRPSTWSSATLAPGSRPETSSKRSASR